MSDTAIDWLDALVELARQVRHGTMELLTAADTASLTWSPPGTSNHILWHAGHAVWLQDALTIRPLTRRSDLPQGWAERFGQHSQPAAFATWPERDEILRRLEAQLDRILNLLVERAETIVARGDSIPVDGGWPLVAGILHGWHDEARHQGEMYLLYKLFRSTYKQQ
jgi:hypothetical protein